MRWKSFRYWWDDPEPGAHIYRGRRRYQRNGYINRCFYRYLKSITVIGLNGRPIPAEFWWAR